LGEVRAENRALVDKIKSLEDKIEELLAQNKLLQGAMLAQDEREEQAGSLCGIPRYLHGCDWPDAVAEEVLSLRQKLAEDDAHPCHIVDGTCTHTGCKQEEPAAHATGAEQSGGDVGKKCRRVWLRDKRQGHVTTWVRFPKAYSQERADELVANANNLPYEEAFDMLLNELGMPG
jgi:hypothetical protein